MHVNERIHHAGVVNTCESMVVISSRGQLVDVLLHVIVSRWCSWDGRGELVMVMVVVTKISEIFVYCNMKKHLLLNLKLLRLLLLLLLVHLEQQIWLLSTRYC